MTATELIGQFNALPPEERAKVVDFIRKTEVKRPATTMDHGAFEQSAKQVFDRHADLMRKLGQ